MSLVKWIGRVLVWPVGLWRSIRQSRKKSEKRLLEEINQITP